MKKTTLPKLPSSFKVYFWDVDWNNLNANREEYESFIVRRLADKGNREAVVWLRRFYTVQQIAEMVKDARGVSEMTRQFWMNYAQHKR